MITANYDYQLPLPGTPTLLISCYGCGQLNACALSLICLSLYAGAHDHASLPSTVNHVIRSAKLEWKRKNSQPQSEDHAAVRSTLFT